MSYHIDDEPRPGALGHLVVNPVWPLLGVMLGGAWLAWPWFAFNGWAVGSPTKGRETAWAIGGFAGKAVLLLAILWAASAGHLEGLQLRYAVLSVTVWSLGVSYHLYAVQSRSFHLHEYFGGVVRNGLPVVLLAFLFGRRALAAVDHGFLRLLLQ